jgi:hypothetical protein
MGSRKALSFCDGSTIGPPHAGGRSIASEDASRDARGLQVNLILADEVFDVDARGLVVYSPR